MPLYKVKPDRTVEHNNVCYFEGDLVEFASEFGAYHEPNIVPYSVPESIEATVDVKSIASEDVFPKSVEFKEDSEDEEEKAAPLVWHEDDVEDEGETDEEEEKLARIWD